MSTLRVTIERLDVHPHPNADRLELAQVGLYRAVVPKGVYRTGDYALYIPEQAVLPEVLVKDLGLTGKLAGKAENRVKAVRLRGELSQGVVCRPDVCWPTGARLDWHDPALAVSIVESLDFAEQLGIEKWVPEIPAHMAGEVEAAPELIRWIEIEDLKRYPDVFTPGEHVVATEKIHGTACLVTYDAAADRLWVSSKGHGSKNLALVESETNLYWRAVRAHDLIAGLRDFASDEHAARVAVFGEVYGAGVQDLHYGANAGRDDTLGFRAFDLVIEDGDHGIQPGRRWVHAADFHNVCDLYDIPAVPVLYNGPFDLDALTAAATGPSTVGGGHIREGVVIRPYLEKRSDVLGGRTIAKLVSPAYLTRKGGTEFE